MNGSLFLSRPLRGGGIGGGGDSECSLTVTSLGSGISSLLELCKESESVSSMVGLNIMGVGIRGGWPSMERSTRFPVITSMESLLSRLALSESSLFFGGVSGTVARMELKGVSIIDSRLLILSISLPGMLRASRLCWSLFFPSTCFS